MKEGWEYKKLKDVALYSIGLTYKPSDVNEEGTIVLRSSNIQNDKLDLNDIVKVSCPIKESLYVQKDDILMCSRNGSAKLVGKVALIPEIKERMTYGTFMMVIRSVYNPYLFYYFKSENFRNQIKHGEANMINQITRYMLDDVYLYVPPLSEQQRIVDYLDSAFAKIDAMKANAEKSLNEAKALFQAALKEMLEPKEGWEEKTLKEICKVINGRAYSKDEMLKQGKYRVLRVGNFFTNDSWYYSDLELEEDKYCDNGDLLYAWSASFGPRIWDGEKVIYHYHIWKMVCSSKIDKYFLCYWLDSDELKKQAMTNLHGATMAHITKGIIEAAHVSFPPLSEQQTIVATLDSLKSKVDRLQANFEKIAQECDALKQAILRQIFE